MFNTTGLFRNIPCPEGEKCLILNCIFSHALRPKPSETSSPEHLYHPTAAQNADEEQGPATKRLKLDNPPATTAHPRPPTLKQNAVRVSDNASYKGPTVQPRPNITIQNKAQPQPPHTLHKTVTPPPLQTGIRVKPAPAARPAVARPAIKETLNPRRLPAEPVPYAKRTLFLKYLHQEMTRLNAEVKKTRLPNKEALDLSEPDLIKAALDEEEQIARGNANVYPNLLKNRVAAYKKMKPDDWAKHVLATIVTLADPDGPSTAPPPPLDTGLPLHQEHLLLEHMIADQAPLAWHGYVPTPPTEDDINEAKLSVAASLNYEVCDRCKSRFRVYPDRRAEDGALTTNGPCLYHWSKPLYPKREKTDAIKGQKETVYGCCHEPLGTKGCTEVATHVFKASEAKRLAAVLPFINTPENPNPARAPNGKIATAVTFDCEMGYTVCGLELMRLTAVTWPENHLLIDVLVRPQGAILDFNTRFSGISQEKFNVAVPYKAAKHPDRTLPPPPPPGTNAKSTAGNDNSSVLSVVDSPAAARDLLCSYITPSTFLIGHALENDLNTVRLCHPRIIDTVLLFPHPRGLPIRNGLKALTKQKLNRDIQMGGASGHDSMEDARATGDLVRYAVKKRWEAMKREGWSIEKETLIPPLLPLDVPPTGETEARTSGAGTGVKRQRIQIPDESGADGLVKRNKMET